LLQCFFTQLTWNLIFSDGETLETPGESAVRLSQNVSPGPKFIFPPDENMLKNEFLSIGSHWYHAIYHIFFTVGSPLSSLMFGLLCLIISHGLGSFGRRLQLFFSHPRWFLVSSLSMFVYFLHPLVMTFIFREFTRVNPAWLLTIPIYFALTTAVILATFTFALFCYILVEQPIDNFLRQRENQAKNTNFLLKIIESGFFVYAIILLISSIGLHYVFYSQVLTLKPPEGYDINFIADWAKNLTK